VLLDDAPGHVETEAGAAPAADERIEQALAERRRHPAAVVLDDDADPAVAVTTPTPTHRFFAPAARALSSRFISTWLSGPAGASTIGSPA
jgi:hypothetical protein